MSLEKIEFRLPNLFNTEMNELLKGRVDNFYKEISFIKDIRKHLAMVINEGLLNIRNVININSDKCVEKYYLCLNNSNNHFLVITIKSYSQMAVYKRLITDSKSVKVYNELESNLIKVAQLNQLMPVIKLLRNSYENTLNTFMMESVTDGGYNYLGLEAINSKLTVEFEFDI